MPRSTPPVTVVVPYYNEAELLPEAIASIRGQDFAGSIEIIVVDDCSTVPIPSSVRNDASVQCIRLPRNSYASAARNRGAESASGEYLTFLDSDDVFFPDRIRTHVEFLQDHPETLMVGAPRITDRDGSSELEFPPAVVSHLRQIDLESHPFELPPEFRSWITAEYAFGTANFTLRTELFRRLGGFRTDFRWGEEWEFQIRLAREGTIGYTPEPGCRYRCRPNSITSTESPWKFDSMARIFRESRRDDPQLPREFQQHCRAEEHSAWLLACQVFLERDGDRKNASRCVREALKTGTSVWAIRSLIRCFAWPLIGKRHPSSPTVVPTGS